MTKKKSREAKTQEADDTFGAEPSEASTLPDGSKAVARRGGVTKSSAITQADEPVAPLEPRTERGDPERGFTREASTEAHVPAVQRGTQKRSAVLRSGVTRPPKS